MEEQTHQKPTLDENGICEVRYAEAWPYVLSKAQKRFEAARMMHKDTRDPKYLQEMLTALKAWCEEEGIAVTDPIRR